MAWYKPSAQQMKGKERRDGAVSKALVEEESLNLNPIRSFLMQNIRDFIFCFLDLLKSMIISCCYFLKFL